jgi:hypothetical protein
MDDAASSSRSKPTGKRGDLQWAGYQQTVSLPTDAPVFSYPPDKRHPWQHIANTPEGNHVFRCRSCGAQRVLLSMANRIAWKAQAAQRQLRDVLATSLYPTIGPTLRKRP